MTRPALRVEAGADRSRGADVQVEHGYTRIANQLLTALALAPWQSAAQRQLVDALVRVSYGFNRRDATVGTADWQRLTGLSGDQVKRARRALASQGVFLLVEEFDAATSRPQRWQLQKDFTRWGRYSVSPAAVTAAEEAAGRIAGEGAQTPPGGAGTPRGHETPQGAQAPPPQGAPITPGEGAQTPPGAGYKSRNDNNLPGGKDRERQERHSSSPSARAEARGLEELKEYLGQHAAAADRFATSAAHSPLWPAAVLGLYGPNGTDELVWKRSPPDRRPALLAVAIDRYAGEGAEYNGRYFRRFVEAVVEEQNGDGPAEGAGSKSRAKGNGGRRPSGRASPPKFDYSNAAKAGEKIEWPR